MTQKTKTIFKIVPLLALVIIIACASEPVSEPSEEVVIETSDSVVNHLIKLVDPLDDPDHYCIDVPGFGSGIRLEAPLQAHTCKPNDNVDEQFSFQASTGQLRMDQYELCVEVESATDDAHINLKECADVPLQQFRHHDDGTLRSLSEGGDSLCIAVAEGPGIAINRIHMRRDLSVRTCDDADPSEITWSFSGGASQPE